VLPARLQKVTIAALKNYELHGRTHQMAVVMVYLGVAFPVSGSEGG